MNAGQKSQASIAFNAKFVDREICKGSLAGQTSDPLLCFDPVVLRTSNVILVATPE